MFESDELKSLEKRALSVLSHPSDDLWDLAYLSGLTPEDLMRNDEGVFSDTNSLIAFIGYYSAAVTRHLQKHAGRLDFYTQLGVYMKSPVMDRKHFYDEKDNP